MDWCGVATISVHAKGRVDVLAAVRSWNGSNESEITSPARRQSHDSVAGIGRHAADDVEVQIPTSPPASGVSSPYLGTKGLEQAYVAPETYARMHAGHPV